MPIHSSTVAAVRALLSAAVYGPHPFVVLVVPVLYSWLAAQCQALGVFVKAFLCGQQSLQAVPEWLRATE